MKKKRYLDLYEKWMERGYFPFLCHVFTEDSIDGYRDEFFALFIPTDEELQTHKADGYSNGLAWGCYDGEKSSDPTELRQNILLFMAAMNGEL